MRFWFFNTSVFTLNFTDESLIGAISQSTSYFEPPIGSRGGLSVGCGAS